MPDACNKPQLLPDSAVNMVPSPFKLLSYTAQSLFVVSYRVLEKGKNVDDAPDNDDEKYKEQQSLSPY